MCPVYLDNSATTPALPSVARRVQDTLLIEYGNPSSLHNMGLRAERILRQARESTASLISGRPERVFFTSGATESNNMALRGLAQLAKGRGRHIMTSEIEHPSITHVCGYLRDEGFDVTYCPVDGLGRVDLSAFGRALRDDTILCSIMAVNNEIGTVQPLAALTRMLRSRQPRPYMHVDAVQAIGKVPFDVTQCGADTVSISAHKFHGPKGVGALYIRPGLNLPPLMWGGEQENGIRPGTENTPGIAGMGEAAGWLLGEWRQGAEHMRLLRDRLIRGITEGCPHAVLNGPPAGSGPEAAPHIINLSFLGLKGETLVHALEGRGIYVSTGSACSSRRPETSHVIRALGKDKRIQEGSVRFSLSPFTTENDIEEAVSAVIEVVRELEGVGSRHA